MRVDRGLQATEAVPLAGSLAGADLLGRLGQGRKQALEGLRERLDALDLELLGDLVDVDAGLGQVLQLSPGHVHVLVQAAAHLAVLAEGGEGGRRNGVDRLRADQLFDVVRVGVARVLGRGARPQAALCASPGLPQLLPARTAEELLPALVGHLRVGDRRLAVQLLQRAFRARVGRGVDLLGKLLVDLRVDAAHEEAGDASDLAQVSPAFVQRLEARKECLHHLGVAVDREDQRDVDVVALGDLVFDRREALFGRRDLDHHVRSRAPVVQILGELDRLPGAVGDRRPDLDAHEPILAFRPVVDGAEHVRRGLDVFHHEAPEHVGRLRLLADELHHGLVVVGRAADRLLEDRGVGRDAGDAFVAKPCQLT